MCVRACVRASVRVCVCSDNGNEQIMTQSVCSENGNEEMMTQSEVCLCPDNGNEHTTKTSEVCVCVLKMEMKKIMMRRSELWLCTNN